MIIDADTILQFKRYLLEEEKSNATISKYIRDVKSFVRFLSGEEATKTKVLEYKTELLSIYAPASVNSIIASINSFFDFCSCPELKLKSIRIQKKIFINKEKELTKDEYRRLLAAAKKKSNRRLYYLMQTICSTGIRVSEVKYVTVESLNSGVLVDVLNGYVNQVGVRLVISDGVLAKSDKYTGTDNTTFFTVTDASTSGTTYTCTLKATGDAKINTELFSTYVRINNNNSKINTLVSVVDNGDGTYTLTFNAATLN